MAFSTWWHGHTEQMKIYGDLISVGTLVAALAAWLPPIAAAFTIVWTVMRIVDEWPKFRENVTRWFRNNG